VREIKFRAQQFNHGKHGFQYGNYVTDNKNYHAIVKESKSSPDEMYNILINPKTLGQFTGLQDNNGIDIYEGDIVESDCYSNGAWFGRNQPRTKYTVKYNNDTGRFCFKQTDRRGDNNSMQVIGNIYENPELLTIGCAK
jgi:uncharacterized phage protein (TIGR01671 family)